MKINRMFILILIIISITGCSNKIKQIDDTKYQELIQTTELTKVYVRDEKEVWKEMHMMANTKIVADEIWGEIEITEERVNYLITEVLVSDYPDKKRLLTILYNWKNEDFSCTVDEHNYLWDKLGGSVGKAYKLKE
ncbi:DUF6241 domain-containing protein [Vallitalea sp.]|uniref:DUF6241 domain-containing protein n=1 Tax=Vallitalea sp. TaxID=1882829 RepID=UPI0025E83C0B|nr:DUF6241 domain-containing protein [Vallitalea sp.]MCT4688211.1 DUF6241 domain-containing protein [Vallitalea sp.]